MPSSARRAVVSLTFFLATCAIGGTFLNSKVSAQSAGDESTLRDNLHQFKDV